MSEWGPWIEHDGLPRPSLMGVEMMVASDDGRCEVGIQNGCDAPPSGETSAWCWALPRPERLRDYPRITRYRIRKPRGLTILEEIARGVKEPQEVGA